MAIQLSLVDKVEESKKLKKQIQKKVETKKKAPKRARKNKFPDITPDMLPKNHIKVTTKEQYEDMISKLKDDISDNRPVAFDTETHTYFDTPLGKKDSVIGINFYSSVHDIAWYVAWGHETGEKQLNKAYVLSKLKPLFENPDVKWIGHNIGYDYQVTKESCGINIANLYYDTLIASRVLNENDDMGLDRLVKRYVKRDDVKSYGAVFGRKTKFSEVPLLTATWYACKDAEATYQLYKFQMEHLTQEKHRKLHDLLFEIEMPLVRVVADMELEGVYIDEEYLESLGVEWQKELDAIDLKMRELFGVDKEFNFKSTPQLRKLFFEDLGLPVIETTDKGLPSTNAATLNKLADRHEGVKLLLQHRELSKLVSTYVNGILNKVIDGKVYPSYNQVGTVTGRFSSTNPNWQNLPSRSDEGRKIRNAMYAPKGYELLSVDYSQIELRILAHLSQDKMLVDAYKEGKDIHSLSASLISEIPYEKFIEAEEVDHPTEEHQRLMGIRSSSKAINFGIIYGQQGYGFAKNNNISVEEAEKFISGWFNAYPGAKKYLDNVIAQAYEKGYVETITGRKRRLYKYMYSTDAGSRAFGERQAMNSGIQGSAADLMKKALIDVSEICSKLGVKIVGTVHDEALFYIPETLTDEEIIRIKKVMENAMQFDVPIVCDGEIQTRWGEVERRI